MIIGVLVEREEFMDYKKELEKQYVSPQKVRLRDVEAWEVSKEHPGKLKFTYNLEDPNSWQEVRITRVRGDFSEAHLAEVQQLYHADLPVKVAALWDVYDTAMECVPSEFIGDNTRWNLYLLPTDAEGNPLPRPTATREDERE